MNKKCYFYKDIWDDIYSKDAQNSNPPLPWMGKCKNAPFLNAFFENEDNKSKYIKAKILDVGCGDGSFCEYLSNLGYENITGIDVSDIIIQKCKEKKDTKVDFLCKDIVNDEFGIFEKYDIIICWFLLHHIEEKDINKFIIKLFNLCKPNGILILSSLYHDGEDGRNSYFGSSKHKVLYYNREKVLELFSLNFKYDINDYDINMNESCTLNEEPDSNQDTYPYCAVKLHRKALKDVLDGIINIFKEKATKANREDLYKLTEELIKQLNVFSNYTNQTNELDEGDYIYFFNRLFRNVSRFICKRIEFENCEKKNKNDVIILKLDSLLNTDRGGRIFSASMYLDKNEIHCRLNGDTEHKVKSRAYELFLDYSKYLQSSKLPNYQQYSLHKHFAEDPNLQYIAFYSSDNGFCSEPKLNDIENFKDYKEFITSIFTNKPERSSYGFINFILTNNQQSKDEISPLEKYGTIAKSFVCVNLGITGFESWGTLMIESQDNKDDIKALFFKKSDANKNKEDGSSVREAETELLHNIKDIIFILKKIDYDFYKTSADRKIKIEAIKSAVAALMARNLSHNIGSHDLTNTKNYFRRRIEDKTLITSEHVLKADYRGAAHLMQYMQERMDFIATVVSTDRYPLGSLNFKAEFFDVLTNDDCGERHTKDNQNQKYEKNFLLEYLLHSEKYTRHGHTCDNQSDDLGDVRLQVILDERLYTGLKEKMEEEDKLKMDLSKLRLAVPGGIMARHALFTLVENILRNSAKHNNHKNELILTIKITISNGKCTLSFYDNCSMEKNVMESISERFEKIQIIDFENNNVIDKNNKGLKEMLICALWLKNKDVAQTLYNIQIGQDKVSNYLRVKYEEGNLCYELDLELFEKYHFIESNVSISPEDNVILLNIDQFLSLHADYVIAKKDYNVMIDGDNEGKKMSEIFPRFRVLENLNFAKADNSISNNCVNVINGELTEEDTNKLIELLSQKEELSPLSRDYNNYKILIDNPIDGITYREDSHIFNIHREYGGKNNDSDIIVYLDHYLNGGPTETKKKLNDVPNALYVDSISGENFTFTLITPDFLEDEILKMKVIDSALIKIAILDERIWEDYHSIRYSSIEIESMFKNNKWQKVLNLINDPQYIKNNNIFQTLSDEPEYSEVKEFWKKLKDNNPDIKQKSIPEKVNFLKEKVEEKIEVEVKNKDYDNFTQVLMEKRNIYIYTMPDDYKDSGKESFINLSSDKSTKECDFLTVHLGLIEKYLGHNEDKGIMDFIELIKTCFKPQFISIHSGRGNFSPELEAELKSYPFISLSAIDAALGNSKYMLSELFFNTNYYGKGNINNNKRV